MPDDRDRTGELARRREALQAELGDEITCDAVTADWVLFQRRRGHRHSTDDLLTAWCGVQSLPSMQSRRDPLALLDLGSGIGSIGLAVLWVARQRPGGARLTAIEAQEVSFRLLEANVDANGASAEVTRIHGDLRDASLLPVDARYDLVTGSPPYFDAKAGVVPEDSQRAHARFELRGDVRDYALAAARVLSEGGFFVLCFPTAQVQRALDAGALAKLRLARRIDVIPREGLAALFSLLVFARAPLETSGGASTAPVRMIVRDARGLHTPELTAARATFGFAAQ